MARGVEALAAQEWRSALKRQGPHKNLGVAACNLRTELGRDEDFGGVVAISLALGSVKDPAARD